MNMHFNSKKTSLVISIITAIVYSRAMFWFFDDPEGPNLLVVAVMATFVYLLSLAIYSYIPFKKQDNPKDLFLRIFIQVVIVIVLYFCLR